MRKLVMAVVAVAAAGLVTTGCERKSEVQRQREDVAEARIDVAKAQQEQQKEIAEARQDANKDIAEVQKDTQEDVADAQKDLMDEQRDLAEAENRSRDLNATGGSGFVSTRTEEVKGTIQSTANGNLTLIVPSQDNRMMSFKSDSSVRVMRDDKPWSLSSLKAGDEVRASYQVDQNGVRMLRSIDLTKVSAQHKVKD